MTRAERHRTAAAIRRANRKALAEFEQMTGGIIEGEIVRQGDAPSEQLRDALARFFVSASWHGGRCMLCRAQMHPPASWPASFFAAYSAPRTLVASFCAARTALDDEQLYQAAHDVMAQNWPQLRRIPAVHMPLSGSRA